MVVLTDESGTRYLALESKKHGWVFPARKRAHGVTAEDTAADALHKELGIVVEEHRMVFIREKPRETMHLISFQARVPVDMLEMLTRRPSKTGATVRLFDLKGLRRAMDPRRAVMAWSD